MRQTLLPEATPLFSVARQHAQSEPSSMVPDAAAGRTMPSAERRGHDCASGAGAMPPAIAA